MRSDLNRRGGYTRGHASLFVMNTGQIIAVDGGRSVHI
jgi:hypothetical protein